MYQKCLKFRFQKIHSLILMNHWSYHFLKYRCQTFRFLTCRKFHYRMIPGLVIQFLTLNRKYLYLKYRFRMSLMFRCWKIHSPKILLNQWSRFLMFRLFQRFRFRYQKYCYQMFRLCRMFRMLKSLIDTDQNFALVSISALVYRIGPVQKLKLSVAPHLLLK
jgi:hypothetical protein